MTTAAQPLRPPAAPLTFKARASVVRRPRRFTLGMGLLIAAAISILLWTALYWLAFRLFR